MTIELTLCRPSNSWYRVRHTVEEDPENGSPVVRFIHPVAPGNGGGGWVKPVEEPKNDEKGPEKTFSLEEIAKHNNKVCLLRRGS